MRSYPYILGECAAIAERAYGGFTPTQKVKAICEHLFLREHIQNNNVANAEYAPYLKQLVEECNANEWRALTPVEQGTAWIGYYQQRADLDRYDEGKKEADEFDEAFAALFNSPKYGLLEDYADGERLKSSNALRHKNMEEKI